LPHHGIDLAIEHCANFAEGLLPQEPDC